LNWEYQHDGFAVDRQKGFGDGGDAGAGFGKGAGGLKLFWSTAMAKLVVLQPA